MQQHSYIEGIEISPAALIHARPARAVTGFAPGGRVSTHMWGANRSVFQGRGMEYAESRAYQPGDDLKTIDWRLTARAGEVHTKMFHEERERPVYILLDLRAMMQFGTRKRFKSHLAAELAAMLAWVGHDGGDRVGGFILTRAGLLEFPAVRTRVAMLGFLHAASAATRLGAPIGEEVSLQTALRKMRDICRPGTLAFVISDFDDDPKAVETELQRLARRAHVTLLVVQDAMDATLPRRGGRFSDGASLLAVDQLGAGARAAHAKVFAERRRMLEQVARKHGMALLRVMTSDDPKVILRPRHLPHGGANVRRAA
jgi:uncharacterized protein (DUF58 family)